MGMVKRQRIKILAWCFLVFLSMVPAAHAAPYFFVTGSSSIIKGYAYHYQIYLHADTTVTAAQTALHFDSSKITKVSMGNLGSRCSFWAPPDPSSNMGSAATPVFHDDNKLVLSCGFSNPGYQTSSLSGGDLIATIGLSVNATASGITSSRLQFGNTVFKYIGQSVSVGNNGFLDLTVYSSTEAANQVTPYPSATPVNPRTVSSNDLNLVNLSSGSAGSSTGLSGASSLLIPTSPGGSNTIAELDDSIPAPPDFTPRPTITPFAVKPDEDESSDFDLGSVLSVQSLRELLLPGKSNADQSVVLVNLLSTIAFLIILTVLVWRLIMISRMNKIKNRHLKEILQGELSALESKLSADLPDEGKSTLTSSMEELRLEVEKDLK